MVIFPIKRVINSFKSYLGIFINFLLSSLMILLALVIMLSLRSPFDKLHRDLNISSGLLLYNTSIHSTSSLKGYLLSDDRVREIIDPQLVVKTTGNITINSTETIWPGLLQPYIERTYNRLQFQSGDISITMGINECYVNSYIAQAYSISTGDVIKVPTSKGVKELYVKAIVLDPYFIGVINTPQRIWVHRDFLVINYSIRELDHAILEFNLIDNHEFNSFLSDLKRNIHFTGESFQGEYVISPNTSLELTNIIFLISSIFVLVLGLFLLYSSITTTISREFSTIGILKALGHRSASIIQSYITQFLILGIIAFCLSIVISLVLSPIVLNNLTEVIGSDFIKGINIRSTTIGFLFYLPWISLISFISLIRIREISPVRAIKFGTNSIKNNRGLKGVFIRFRGVVGLSISFIFKSRKRFFTILISFIFIIYFAIMASLNQSSFDEITKVLPMWGHNESDLMIIINGKESKVDSGNFLEMLQNREDVTLVLPAKHLLTEIPAFNSTPPFQTSLNLYRGGLEEMGYINLEGRHPEAGDELSLGAYTAKMYGVGIGDTFPISYQGVYKEFEIVGLYQTIGNGGHGVRAQDIWFRTINPFLDMDWYYCKLTESENIEDFHKGFMDKFGYVAELITKRDTITQIRVISDIVGQAILGLTLLFSIIVLLITVNAVTSTIRDDRKTIGLLKTIGYMVKDLIKVFVIQYLFMFLIALFITIPIAIFTIPPLMTRVGSGMGMVQFPIYFSFGTTLLYILLVLTFVVLGAVLASKRCKHVSCRELIKE